MACFVLGSNNTYINPARFLQQNVVIYSMKRNMKVYEDAGCLQSFRDLFKYAVDENSASIVDTFFENSNQYGEIQICFRYARRCLFQVKD